jgi:hypothetical protein
MKDRQLKAVAQLVDRLGPGQVDPEANLNASIILSDLMENKDYFAVLSKKAVQQKLFDIIHAPEHDKSSKCAAMVVLSKYIYQFKNGKEDNDSDKGADEDDDIIIHNESENEEDKGGDSKDKAFFDVLASHVEPMKTILKSQVDAEYLSSLNSETYRPLGILRMRAVELLNQIIKVNQPVIFDAFKRSNIMAVLMELCEMHVWQNLMHIKIHEMWDCIFRSAIQP